MPLPPGLRRVFRLSGARPDPRTDINAEIDFHLQTRIDELVARGLSPEAAQAQALKQFGPVGLVAGQVEAIDHAREDRRARREWWAEFGQDLRYALRAARRSPSYALVVALTFAIGIGSNTAVFSLLNAVVLRPLPLPGLDGLVRIYEKDTNREFGQVTAADFHDWRGAASSFEGMAAFRFRSFALVGASEAEQLSGAIVSPDFFAMLRVPLALGRGFRAEDGAPGAPAVVVLSHPIWVRVFGADSGVVGREVRLNETPTRVVGVLPAGFPDLISSPTHVWTASTFEELAHDPVRGRRFHALAVFGRVKDGVPVARAREELRAIGQRLARDYPEQNRGHEPNVVPLQEAGTESVRPVIWMVMGAVAFVMLIACANLANLVFARTLARGREFALRSAIGAGRVRLARQVVTEQLVLAMAGAAVGVLAAVWSSGLFARTFGASLPRAATVSPDLRVLGFALAATVAAALLSGLIPALWAARGDHTGRLKAGGSGSTLSRRGHRLRASLVAVQVALAGVLLVGCGLALRSLSALLAEELGFRTEAVWSFSAVTVASRYPDDPSRVAFQHEFLSRIRAIPGVEAASASYGAPMANVSTTSIQVDGQPAGDGPRPEIGYNAADGQYFRTLGIPLVAGRLMDGRDRQDTPPVVVVNQVLADRFWPGQDPIGKRARMGPDPEGPWIEVIGVVGNIRRRAVGTPPEPEAYFPLAQHVTPGPTYVVRVTGDPAPVLARIKETLRQLDPTIPMSYTRPVAEAVSDTMAPERILGALLTLFAAIALTLAGIGIYGVIAFLVAERRREIGVRMALGAEARAVLGEVIGRGMRPVAAGLAVGLAAAYGLGRTVRSLFYQVTPGDPLTYAAVGAVLLLAGLLGCLAPARRAAGVDPAGALKE